jgi:prephenate dehydrogenase
VRVALLGIGLMGGSLGLALRASTAHVVVGFDPDPTALASALERGAVAEAAPTLEAACAGADVVVACSPVATLPEVVARALAAAPEHALVTDIGSTKANVVGSIAAADEHRFVGGHPMCGLETRGIGDARADLFEGATWFLTPEERTDPVRFRRLHGLVQSLGGRPVAIAAAAHDELLAITSHLPHALANVLATQAAETPISGHEPLLSGGGSFRDMTRVAGANARIWLDIMLDNRTALAAALRDHRRRIEDVIVALDAGDAAFLGRWIGDAADARRRSVEASYDAPAGDLWRLSVRLPDRPGSIMEIAQALGAARVNIEDMVLDHESPEAGGVIEVVVRGASRREVAVEALLGAGYAVAASPLLEDAVDPEAVR